MNILYSLTFAEQDARTEAHGRWPTHPRSCGPCDLGKHSFRPMLPVGHLVAGLDTRWEVVKWEKVKNE